MFSGNIKTSIGKGTFADHLVEQLIPSDRWGKEFVTAPIPERSVGDVFRLVSKTDGTIINVPGMAPIHLNAGDRKEFELPSQQYTHITSNQPVMLAQFVKSQQDPQEPADPSMMIIPPYEQFGSDYTFTTPEYSHPEYGNASILPWTTAPTPFDTRTPSPRSVATCTVTPTMSHMASRRACALQRSTIQ